MINLSTFTILFIAALIYWTVNVDIASKVVLLSNRRLTACEYA